MNDTETRSPHPIDRHVGALIRLRRRALKISQTELATAVGVTFQQVQKYERGANRVSASKLYEIAQKLDTPLVAFFEGLDGPVEEGRTPRDEVIRFLDQPGSHALVKAFSGLRPQVRGQLVALAQALATAED
ncbi:helix-turn-helix domain-containing protein [Caulobacter soli]|uniref:helix-turn-helix domain-containing protein n=1 Tax=Caulobacter soli TaxID=2708539 RepID=UPI0013EAD67B|nr:helix-turn-helix transcriptional regulator [Caulobacter soli]